MAQQEETIEQAVQRIEKERTAAVEQRAREIADAVVPYMERIEADKRAAAERRKQQEEAAAAVVALGQHAQAAELKARARAAYLDAGGTDADFEQDWPAVRARMLAERVADQERETWQRARGVWGG